MRWVAVSIIAVLAGTASAGAQESAYTRIDENCAQRQMPDEPVWETACAGFGDWSVYFIASDHGAASAYSYEGGMRSDWLNPPMRGLFGYYNDVIEWRTANGEAYATIHRYISETPRDMGNEPGENETRQTLIVTSLRPEEYEVVACPVAFIDATAMSNANEAARLAADGLASDFQCGSEEPYEFATSVDDVHDLIQSRIDHH